MRVAVTGGTGKVGRALLRELHDTRPDWEVRSLDLTLPEYLMENVRFVQGSITDREAVTAVMEGVDVVVHVAAVPRPTVASADEIVLTNIVGTFIVYDVAASAGVRRIVLVSSTAVLGDDWGPRDVLPQQVPIDEDHPLEPEDVYGLSKLCAEEIASAFARRGVERVVIRPGWVIDDADAARLRASGGSEVRGLYHYSYIHVEDLAVALRHAAEAPDLSVETMFVVADDSTLGSGLAEALAPLDQRAHRKYLPLGPVQCAITNQRAKNVLGWAPRRSWRDQL